MKQMSKKSVVADMYVKIRVSLLIDVDDDATDDEVRESVEISLIDVDVNQLVKHQSTEVLDEPPSKINVGLVTTFGTDTLGTN